MMSTHRAVWDRIGTNRHIRPDATGQHRTHGGNAPWGSSLVRGQLGKRCRRLERPLPLLDRRLGRKNTNRPPPKSAPTRANSVASQSVGWNRDQIPGASQCQPMPPGHPPVLTRLTKQRRRPALTAVDPDRQWVVLQRGHCLRHAVDTDRGITFECPS